MLIDLYNTILFQPIYNILVFLYDFLPGNDIALAIIILTLGIRLIFYPLSKKSIESQKALQELQPKLEELKKKYKSNQEEMAKQTMALYRDNKINPLSSCLPMLIQLPFLIAIYQVFRAGFDASNFHWLYSFIPNPGNIDPYSLGLNLAEPQWMIAALAAVAQFWQAKMMLSKKPPIQSKGAQDEALTVIMQKQMVYVLPIMTLVIGLQFPGGLALYWLVSTLATAIQQYFIMRNHDSASDDSKIIEIKE